jgi:CheY-like chemotaxis protein
MPRKIMVVDDEENVLTLVKAVLDQEGFNVMAVISGQECLKKLKDAKPELILMDMMMPGMSGRETVEKIRADPKNKSIKIIFVTVARFSEVGKETLGKLKVSDYITKPFDNEDLVKRVKAALK